MKNSNHILKMTLAAVCLALCMVLPFLTANIPEIGSALCPMHIPVFLCAFLCGPWWAVGVGAAAPLLRFLLVGMPPVFPTGLAMCFELAAYGLCAGLMYRLLPKKVPGLYATLLISMVVGRIVSVLAKIVVFSIAAKPVTVSVFITEAFVNTLPGAALHLALIPPVVMALQRALPWLKKSK